MLRTARVHVLLVFLYKYTTYNKARDTSEFSMVYYFVYKNKKIKCYILCSNYTL